MNTIAFLTYSPSQQTWRLGEASSFTESITLLDGNFDGDQLVLKTAVRMRGGMRLTYLRGRYEQISDKQFSFLLETSNDGKSRQKQFVKTYKKRQQASDLWTAHSEFGSPAPDSPEQARQFDFLIGEFDAFQEITLPNGQTAKFPSISTAVYALNGHAILEFNWYDVDANLPDAATSIIRIYNRAMRRWESLYITNRVNNLLYFGGKMEGDRMVLHFFDVNTDTPSISHFIFHSIAKDSYAWFAESSRDRGKSFTKTWLIDFTRKK